LQCKHEEWCCELAQSAHCVLRCGCRPVLCTRASTPARPSLRSQPTGTQRHSLCANDLPAEPLDDSDLGVAAER
jgi:hypothetical protein